uniref:Uncharacterized protein n=1 Tax=Romanomermis culicivorax TaxID=13658 RepID=A0A915K7A2_ROMCU
DFGVQAILFAFQHGHFLFESSFIFDFALTELEILSHHLKMPKNREILVFDYAIYLCHLTQTGWKRKNFLALSCQHILLQLTMTDHDLFTI